MAQPVSDSLVESMITETLRTFFWGVLSVLPVNLHQTEGKFPRLLHLIEGKYEHGLFLW